MVIIALSEESLKAVFLRCTSNSVTTYLSPKKKKTRLIESMFAVSRCSAVSFL
jgi:hypothetical protein